MVVEMKIEELITILQANVQDKIVVLEQRLSNNMTKLNTAKEDKLGMLEKMSLSSSIKNHQAKLKQYEALATNIKDLQDASLNKHSQLDSNLKELFAKVAGRLSDDEVLALQKDLQNIYETKNAPLIKSIKETIDKVEKQIKSLGLGSTQIMLNDGTSISYFALTNNIENKLLEKYLTPNIVFSNDNKDGGIILMGDAYLVQKLESLGFEFLKGVDERIVTNFNQIKKNVDLKGISEKTIKLINLLIKRLNEEKEVDYSKIIARLDKNIAAHQKEITRINKVIDNYGLNDFLRKIDGMELI